MRVAAGFCLLLAGCAPTAQLMSVTYQFEDDPVREEVRVLFQNTTGRRVCLTPEHWPNAAGWLNQSADRVAIIVDGRRFPIRDWNTGYCPRGCAIEVEPDQQVSASIPYSNFELPDDHKRSEKTLQFAPVASRC